jgi:hypothetical protein
MEKGYPLRLNKFESPSPKDNLCQVWLKLAQWLWRRRFLNDPIPIFSSPELKAQVSYSDRPLSIIRLSVCKPLHFLLLLQNHWANFNQTWHKSSMGGGDSKLFT